MERAVQSELPIREGPEHMGQERVDIPRRGSFWVFMLSFLVQILCKEQIDLIIF